MKLGMAAARRRELAGMLEELLTSGSNETRKALELYIRYQHGLLILELPIHRTDKTANHLAALRVPK